MYSINKSLIVSVTLLLTLSTKSVLALDYATYERPFAVNSLWNSTPIAPVFSDFIIPNSVYNPTAYGPSVSATCFYTDENDPPVTIKIGPGYGGIHDRDGERLVSKVDIPHWPSNVSPATGGDGHADVIDVENKIIHSFYKLKFVNGEWTSLLYAWAPLDGRGWGDPAHFYQGGRATGIPACAGMIRTHEVNDGDVMYRHALAMSITDNALSKAYVFPSTSTDVNVSNYSGSIPEGALLMLPSSFNVARLSTPLLRKIANTLKTYGAYVVDRNYGTPYLIYSEIGAPTQSIGTDYYEHTLIQKALRVVISTDGYIDANGQPFQPDKNLNILSFRGPWARGYNYQANSELCTSSCESRGVFDTYKQAVTFEATDEAVIQSNYSGRTITRTNWARPKKGEIFKLNAITTGEGKLRIVIRDPNRNDYIAYDSGYLVNGQSAIFTWPIDDFETTTIISSGVGEPSSVSGTLLRSQ